MPSYLSCGLLGAFLSVTDCHRTNPADVSTNDASARTTVKADAPCGGSAKPVKTVQNQAGVVRFNAGENQYSVVVTIPNTIDAQDVGVVCNLPDKLKVEGLAITFDGVYRPYDKTPKQMLGGQSLYYLTVNKLTSEKGSL